MAFSSSSSYTNKQQRDKIPSTSQIKPNAILFFSAPFPQFRFPMATNHHHHQCHCLPTPSTTTTCYCTMCYTTTPYHHPPPPPQPSDPLIHSTSSHHHHQHPQIHHYPPPQNHHSHHPPPPPPQTHQKHHLFRKYYHHDDVQETPPPLNPTVSSLVHRIAALESALRRRKQSPPPSSLRHAAARTIQTHFRAFLVRRSVTLRHLKDLAHIKSALNRLKSSVASKTHFDSHTLSRESMNLLVKLDSVQGSDPMIRDGKRAISRELIRFMEQIDEMCLESTLIAVKNVGFGKNSKKSVILQQDNSIKPSGSRVFAYSERKIPASVKNHRKIVNEVDESFNGVSEVRIGDLTKSQSKCQPKVKKYVRFDEDGNVYRLFKSKHDSVSSGGSDCSNGDGEQVEVIEEIGVSSKEPEVEEDDSSEMSENEMDPRKNLSARIHHTTKKNQPDDDDDEEDDSFVFSAPLPAKMEY